jgi:hypothetical protein
VDYVRGRRNDELDAAGVYIRRSAIILNTIDLRFERCNAGMLTTFCRENDRAQPSAGLQSIETRFQTAVQLETSPVINPEV